MPRICEFYGIVIAMYYRDHAPPHFHALYGEFEAEIRIDSLEVLKGTLPRRAQQLISEWAPAHQHELELAWDRARRHEPLGTIAPLE